VAANPTSVASSSSAVSITPAVEFKNLGDA